MLSSKRGACRITNRCTPTAAACGFSEFNISPAAAAGELVVRCVGVMLFLSDDLVLETFDSPDHPPADLEWIDVENDEYEFCDEDGQRYRGELVHRGGFFKFEKWRLVPDGEPNLEYALSLVDRAVMVDSSRCSFPDLESLRKHLTRRCS